MILRNVNADCDIHKTNRISTCSILPWCIKAAINTPYFPDYNPQLFPKSE